MTVNTNLKNCNNKFLEKVMKILLDNGIQVRPVWYPNHMQKPFLKNQSFLVKNSLKLFKESICLPSSHSLSKNQLRFIISTIKKYAKNI